MLTHAYTFFNIIHLKAIDDIVFYSLLSIQYKTTYLQRKCHQLTTLKINSKYNNSKENFN